MADKFIGKVSGLFSKYLNSGVVLILDWALMLIASGITLLFAVMFTHTDLYSGFLAFVWMISALILSPLLEFVLGTYRIVIRHSTFMDVARYIFQCAVKALAILLIIALCGSFDVLVFNGSIWLLVLADFLFSSFLMVGVRALMIIVYKVFNNKMKERQKYKNIFVFGTSDKSVAILTRLQNSPHYKVCGFITDRHRDSGMHINELPVFYVDSADRLDFYREASGAECLLFATLEDLERVKDSIVCYCGDCGIKTLISPGIDEYKSESDSHSGIREVKIEDLLGRDEINISLLEIKKYFKGKVVMVTGAAGSIGSELVRQLSRLGVRQLVLFDNAETPMHNLRLELEESYPALDFVPVIGDVRQKPRLDYAFRRWKPQVVFHAAAYKHVPLMEDNPCEAVNVNLGGSHNVADKCVEYGVEMMVMISTDKAVNPTNIMGCTKRLAEIYVQSLGLAIARGSIKGRTKFVTTRFGNVLGSNGSVIPLFREQIAKGGPVTVTHPDINRFFMTIPEACRLVMEAAIVSSGNQIVVFDMGQPVKIDSLARKMIQLAGFVPDRDIKIKYTGLRPGEKLYEEVLSSVENTDPTVHDRIRLARVREYDYSEALESVNALEEYARDVDIPEMVKLMKKVVPEFRSKNSQFEIYDR